MKAITIFLAGLAALVHQCQWTTAHGISPLIDEVEMKKSLFYNRKPNEKVKVIYVPVPSGEERSEEMDFERKSGMMSWEEGNWSGYGQPPLNPSGPPLGLYSPGNSYYKKTIQKRRNSPRPPKRRYRPTRPPFQMGKTPCPYKMLAEEFAEQQRLKSLLASQSPPMYYPPPTPPPTTTTSTTTPPPTTTTTTTPAPALFLGQSLMSQFGQQPVLYQTLDPMITLAGSSPQQQQQTPQIPQELLQRLHQQTGLHFEPFTPPEQFQSPVSSSGDPSQIQVFMDSNNNAYIIQPAALPQTPQTSIQNQHQVSPNLASLPQLQPILLKPEGNPNIDIMNLLKTQMLLSSPSSPGSSTEHSQPQPIGRIGNHIIYDKQLQQLGLSPSLPQHQSVTVPTQQQQQPQLILLDNLQNSQTAPQAIILPNGQIVPTQQQHQQTPTLPQNPSSHQPFIIFNSQSQAPEPVVQQSAPAFQIIQPATTLLNRTPVSPPINFANQNLPDLSSLFSSESGLRHKNRGLSSSEQLPIIHLSPPKRVEEEDEEEEEESRSPVIVHSRKKSRRKQQRQGNNRENEKKRFVVISKKELDQIKNKKREREEQNAIAKNLPPPPEVVHLPFINSREEEDGEEEEEDEERSRLKNHKMTGSKSETVPIIHAGDQSSFSTPEEKKGRRDDDEDDNSED